MLSSRYDHRVLLQWTKIQEIPEKGGGFKTEKVLNLQFLYEHSDDTFN